MPFQKKYSDEVIKAAYEEWKKSGMDLFNFCKMKGYPYWTFRKRFIRLERGTSRPPTLGRPRPTLGGRLDEYDSYPEELEETISNRVAREAVTSTIHENIASEAANLTQAHLELGRAVWTEIADAAAKEGIPASRLSEYPALQRIREWRTKAEEYQYLKEENERMRRLLDYYQSQYSPLEHARNLIRLVNESLLAIAVLKKAGFKINKRSGIVKLMNEQIVKFANMGGVET